MKIRITFFCVLITLVCDLVAQQKTRIKVNNAEEFIKAIGSDRIIELSADTFYLRDLAALKHLAIDESGSSTLTPFVEYGGGRGIEITRVSNLEIVGYKEKELNSILSSRDYGDAILTFSECKNITVKNVEMNHVPKAEGHCTGGVLYFDRCENVLVEGCTLIGSGSFGLNLDECKDVKCSGTVIKECSVLLSELKRNKNVLFEKSTFLNIRCDGYLIIATDNINLSYKECTFSKNFSYNKPGDYEYKADREVLILFYDDKISADILFEKCTFSDNKILKFSNKNEIITKKENKFVNNDGLK